MSSQFRRLQSSGATAAADSLGRDRRIVCVSSVVPGFTAERIRRGQSRAELAAELADSMDRAAPPWIDDPEARSIYVERMLVRIEREGQVATNAFAAALADVWQIRLEEADSLLERGRRRMPTPGQILNLQELRHGS